MYVTRVATIDVPIHFIDDLLHFFCTSFLNLIIANECKFYFLSCKNGKIKIVQSSIDVEFARENRT